MALGLLPVGEATRWHVEPNSTGNVYKLGLPCTNHTPVIGSRGKTWTCYDRFARCFANSAYTECLVNVNNVFAGTETITATTSICLSSVSTHDSLLVVAARPLV